MAIRKIVIIGLFGCGFAASINPQTLNSPSVRDPRGPSEIAADNRIASPGEFPEDPTVSLGRLGSFVPSNATPSPDILGKRIKYLGNEFVRREGVWSEAERTTYKAALANTIVDTLVLPAQVQGLGTDRISRSVWAAKLTAELARSGVKVVDPYLVSRALGEGERVYAPERVRELATFLKARRVIETFIGHDRHHQLTILVRVHNLDRPGTILYADNPQIFSWTSLAFSDERPPILLFDDPIRQLREKLKIDASNNLRTGLSAPGPAWRDYILPANPIDLVKSDESIDTAPLRFAVLGAMSPAASIRARERFFEKSLISLDSAKLSPDQAKFLRAYALFNLQMRPAAIAALKGGTEWAANLALQALFDGNLPELSQRLQQVNGIERLLLAVELNDLRARYDLQKGPWKEYPRNAALQLLQKRSAAWSFLVRRRLTDLNLWEVDDNSKVKMELDRLFPIAGQSAHDLRRRGAALGSQSDLETVSELSVLQHVRELPTFIRIADSARGGVMNPGAWDLVFLYEALAESTLLKSLQFESEVQGRADDALKRLERWDVYYDGHPEFLAWRARLHVQIAGSLPADQQSHHVQVAQEAARASVERAQGQTQSTIKLLYAVSGDYGLAALTNAYSFDFPVRDYWLFESTGFYGTERARLNRYRDALNYTQFRSMPAVFLADYSESEFKDVGRRALETRFHGDPGVASWRSGHAIQDVDPQHLTDALRAAIKSDPENWNGYRALAWQLLHDGDDRGAADVYVSFPPFRHSRGSETVTLSNFASEAAGNLLSRAATGSARRLYQIAARYSNGSEASMEASLRISVIDGRYGRALQIARRIVHRYQDGGSYADLIALLSLTGHHREAEDLFEAVSNGQYGFAPWRSAMITQRINKLPDAKMPEWIRQHVAISKDPIARRLGARIALRWYQFDREPIPDLGSIVAHLAGDPSGTMSGGDGASYVNPDDPMTRIVVFPSNFRHALRTKAAYESPVDSDVTLFSRAYALLLRRDFHGAVEAFDALAARYNIETYIENGSAVDALGPFAYASSKVGDPLKLEEFIAKIPPRLLGFDHFLAKAFFAGGRRDTEAALMNLHNAYNRMVPSPSRLTSIGYQFGQACEWLTADLKDRRFESMELDFARRLRVSDPFLAWPHAVSALASTDPKERSRELAYAVYLDNGSPRLNAFGAQELESARKRVASGSPFGESMNSIRIKLIKPQILTSQLQ